MRFLLYNIRYATGHGTRFHLPFPFAGYLKRSGSQLKKIVSFMESVQPDIIGLVEVDGGSFRTSQQCQAENIARQLAFDHVIETKYAFDSMATRMPLFKSQGNAILSKMEIVSHRFHYFEEGVKRLIIQACMERVTVFLVHLSLTYKNRQYQLERLYRLIREVDRPVILAGDFNVLWGKRELELFLGATGLVSANPEKKPSYPSRSPKRELDFILHSPELKVVNFQIPTITYSDHAPLICDFEW
ncbi:endonuclease/exonuclease/phosphatase family protein [Desulfogranum mediterraneum]|uniref:endonuclease/exonuclease/phosphatase family protein n=1 Tax=Desulfogranum mediterraneum TaxID=160661 RepID=UPI0003F6FD24|nr:endonuclease/exonuclease/phosphatase family protein [Desulfogranum mediterraneum]